MPITGVMRPSFRCEAKKPSILPALVVSEHERRGDAVLDDTTGAEGGADLVEFGQAFRYKSRMAYSMSKRPKWGRKTRWKKKRERNEIEVLAGRRLGEPKWKVHVARQEGLPCGSVS